MHWDDNREVARRIAEISLWSFEEALEALEAGVRLGRRPSPCFVGAKRAGGFGENSTRHNGASAVLVSGCSGSSTG
jgi:hypothetical protein